MWRDDGGVDVEGNGDKVISLTEYGTNGFDGLLIYIVKSRKEIVRMMVSICLYIYISWFRFYQIPEILSELVNFVFNNSSYKMYSLCQLSDIYRLCDNMQAQRNINVVDLAVSDEFVSSYSNEYGMDVIVTREPSNNFTITNLSINKRHMWSMFNTL